MRKIFSAAFAICVLANTSIAQTPSVNTRNLTSSSAGNSPVAAPVAVPDYVIGPADVLEIKVRDDASFSGTVFVRPDGKITIYSINDVQAAGMTTTRLGEQITKGLAKYFKGDPPPVTVTLLEMKSKMVYIEGKGIAKPGNIPLSGPMTVMQLISIAGGLKEYAKGRDIKIFRMQESGTEVLKFNYETFQSGTELAQNVELRPGDIVDVP